MSRGRRYRLRGRIQQPGAGSGASVAVSRAGRRTPRPIASSIRPRSISYGPGARHTIDFFAGDGEGPIVVFIHGGYWQAFDASSFQPSCRRVECPWHRRRDSELRSLSRRHHRPDHPANADGLARTGAARAAAGHQRPFRRRPSRRLFAGDRLAGVRCVVAIRSCASRPTPFPACSISARWSRPPSITPCVSTMSRREPRARCSGPRRGGEVSMRSWGLTKARNISGRARAIVEAWGEAGLPTRFGTVPDANHITAIAPLADPDSPMVARLKELAGR